MFCTTPRFFNENPKQQVYDSPPPEKDYLDRARDTPIFQVETNSTTCSVESDYSDYRDINVKVQLLGLMNGIVMENSKKLAKNIKSNKTSVLGEEDIFAVITGFNEVPSSDKRVVVATHLPSLPIESKRSTSNAQKHNIMAVWPADFDPNGNETSSITFTRKMKREKISSLAEFQKHNAKTCLYTTESLVLAVGLRKGNEIITLGTVMVHFTGSEKHSIQSNLPVKTTKLSVKKAVAQMKGTKIKKKKDKQKFKLMKPVSFKSDQSRSYYLAEDTVLSMLVESTDPKKVEVKSEEEKDEQNHFLGTEIVLDDSFPLTQQDVILDLAKICRSDESDDHCPVNIDAAVQDILSMPNIQHNSRNLSVDISEEHSGSYQIESATVDYVISPVNRSQTSSYMISSMQSKERRNSTNNHRPVSSRDWDLENVSSSTNRNNPTLSASWVPTPETIAQKFDFKNFDDI